MLKDQGFAYQKPRVFSQKRTGTVLKDQGFRLAKVQGFFRCVGTKPGVYSN